MLKTLITTIAITLFTQTIAVKIDGIPNVSEFLLYCWFRLHVTALVRVVRTKEIKHVAAQLLVLAVSTLMLKIRLRPSGYAWIQNSSHLA